MVVLVSRKPKYAHKRLQEKLDHLFHHQKPEDGSGFAALQAFRAKVSDGLQGLIADSIAEITFSWVEQGFKLLHGLNSGFKKLIKAVDHPQSKWGSALADEYFDYTLQLLDLFNSISNSLAHLQSVRLYLAHVLSSPSYAATRLLKSTHHQTRNWVNEEESGNGNMGDDGESCHGKERMVLEAVVEMKAVALWVCRVVLCGLGGEMIKKDSEATNNLGYEIPLLVGVDSRVYGELVEVKEMKEMVAVLLLGDPVEEEAKEMQMKVEMFQRKLEETVEEVNCLFSEVLASRDRLMDCFRLNKQ